MTPFKQLLPAGSIALALTITGAVQGAVGATQIHKVVDIVFDKGNPHTTIPTGHTTMEVATVNCKYASCTIAMNIMSSVGRATCTNEWSILGLLDGKSVDGGPYQDALPHSGNTQTRTWQGIAQSAYGSHTLAFQLYVPCDVTANQWSVSYLVTTP